MCKLVARRNTFVSFFPPLCCLPNHFSFSSASWKEKACLLLSMFPFKFLSAYYFNFTTSFFPFNLILLSYILKHFFAVLSNCSFGLNCYLTHLLSPILFCIHIVFTLLGFSLLIFLFCFTYFFSPGGWEEYFLSYFETGRKIFFSLTSASF